MTKVFYLILLIFIFIINFNVVSSIDYDGYKVYYDFYEDLNTPTTISLYGNFTNESQVAMVYENTYQYLDINNGTEEDEYYFDVTISSDYEQDFMFDLYGSLIDSPEKFNYNKTDRDNYNQLTITNDNYYTMKTYHYNHTLEPKTNLICINVDTNNKLRNVEFLVGTTNETDNITWFNSIERDIQSDGLETFCEYVSAESKYINHTDYMGFRCNDCTLGGVMYLGVKDNIYNSSYYFEDEQTPVYQDLDYMISFHDETPTDLKQRIPGEIKFRESFNVTFDFKDINNISDDYFSNYNYIYLQPIDNGFTSELDSSMDQLLDFSWVDNIMGITSSEDVDTELSFWGSFVGNSGTVKLYEEGNYSVNLISARSLSTSYSWDQEFYYPQNDEFKYSVDIVNIKIENETNQNFYIKLDQYEVNKTQFWLNFLRNSLLIISWLVLLSLIGYWTKSPYLVIVMGSLTLPILLKLIGVWL